MRDLLICVPSRGRPERFAQMAHAALALSEADTRIAVATDRDDPSAASYQGSERIDLWQGARQTVSAWTNTVALAELGNYRAFCSMSDDHVPRTQGWDRLLLEAIGKMGGTGIAYGDDLLQGENLPTCWVVSADIVEALGWLALPVVRHFWMDNAAKALGEAAGCLAYVPQAVIEHCHPGAGKAAFDETYAYEAARDAPDEPAYRAWERGRLAADAAKVIALREAGRRADVR